MKGGELHDGAGKGANAVFICEVMVDLHVSEYVRLKKVSRYWNPCSVVVGT
jgi:hypothetical protein